MCTKDTSQKKGTYYAILSSVHDDVGNSGSGESGIPRAEVFLCTVRRKLLVVTDLVMQF